MPHIKVNVKWNAKRFDNVDLDTDDTALTFKTQLFSLTGVEPDRQKILVKGGMLKDDTNLNSLNLKDGHTFMMMGTAGELPKAPEKKVVFLEDMSETQLQKAYDIPSGLQNLGNTCYLNATLQCLRAIPELQTALAKAPGSGVGSSVSSSVSGNANRQVTSGLRDLYRDLNTSADADYTPLAFVQLFRAVFPKYNERSRTEGGYLQQDAEECWTELMMVLRDQLRQPAATDASSSSDTTSVVDQYMTGEMEVTMQCDDNPEETPTVKVEPFYKLSCHIDKDTNYLATGLESALTEKLEKRSSTLDREATYTRTARITRLPAYLVVNFVRFYWKNDVNVEAKIMRKVKFPQNLDMTEFCRTDLQAKLRPAKEAIREAEEKQAMDKANTAGETAMQVDGAETPATGKAAETTKPAESLVLDPSLKSDVGCNPSGQYELCAVLTHIGRSSDSGHYIAWVRNKKTDDWFKFDDDQVSVVKEADIEKLAGGGDWHTAYICLYRAKTLPA
ncbi:deubiquitinating enzyme [Tieghemiomyces parasiticus]|uniref:Ubiquitin carboxyl-terminal hydrolase n=1 Tax=Tieghemiomyces parasiticus TaxID=78921 RepID=A0A9W8AFS4_9FUNG|nr:deubiquitinating enzyme [Tieghemiomyces parasiticus]